MSLWEFEAGTAHDPLSLYVSLLQGGGELVGATEAISLSKPIGPHMPPTQEHRMERTERTCL